jgi:hypothetical protein
MFSSSPASQHNDLAEPFLPEVSIAISNSSDVTQLSRQPAQLTTASNLTTFFHADQKKTRSKARALMAMVTIGIARDATWAWQVVKQQDYFDGKLGAFFSPTLTQMIGAIPAVLIAGHFSMRTYNGSLTFTSNRREWLKRLAVFGVASWSAVPVWNGAELLGTFVGNKLSLSARNADYFAGGFTGVAETIWQNAIVIPNLLGEPIDPVETAFNALGGAVWKWVITACLVAYEDQDNSEYKTAPSVAFSVAASTLMMTLLAWLINYTRRQANESQAAERNRLFSNQPQYARDDLDVAQPTPPQHFYKEAEVSAKSQSCGTGSM